MTKLINVKAYVAATGTMFVLIVLAHIARLFAEGGSPIADPVFLVTSVLSLGAAGWAVCVYRSLPRQDVAPTG